MNISTLNDLVYTAVQSVDVDEQLIGESLINRASTNRIDSEVANEISNFTNTKNIRVPFERELQPKALLDSVDYMDDFFPPENPSDKNQVAQSQVVPNNVVQNNGVPNNGVQNNVAQSRVVSSPLVQNQLGEISTVGQPFGLYESGVDFDVERIRREMLKTLYSGVDSLGAFSELEIEKRVVDVVLPTDSVSPLFEVSADSARNPVNVRQPAQPKIPVRAFESGVRREFDIAAIRNDFPILSERVHGKPLVWFDNSATTQKPNAVIDRLRYFYEHENSNVHRGAHDLAARSTDAYERSREIVRRFLNASSTREIIFVRGTTEAINLVAATWGKDNIHAGDEIVVSNLEHHANIVPWQILSNETGAVLRVIPVNDAGDLLLERYTDILRGGKVKLVAVTQVSNAIGTITPTEEIVRLAHQFGAKVLIDGAQSVSHFPTDVQFLDADFFVFSGHKIFAPTGIGVLYGKESILELMRPYQSGGGMISDVTFERTVYNSTPSRFEAGTGNIADAVGLGAAIEYVESIGIESIHQYEQQLFEHAIGEFAQIAGVQIIGNSQKRAAVLSFLVDGLETGEVNKILAAEGIAVRAGHHCAQPILRRLGVESTVRASFAFYNTLDEIDSLVKIIKNISSNNNSRR
jgi:cysteine desulfurase/selenocysteine lyase